MATNEHIIKAPGMMKNLAVGGHLTTADQVLDDAIGKEQSQINAETATAITNEVSRAEAAEELLRQAYEALTQSTPVPVTELPESGEEGVIYRLAGETSYSDYMWNGEEFVKMAEYDNAIDEKPTAGSDNLVKSKGVAGELRNEVIINRSNAPKTGFINSSDQFNSEAGSGVTIDVNNGDIVSVHNLLGATTYIAFLKKDCYVDTLEFSSDYPGRITIRNLYKQQFTVPSDCKYLYVTYSTSTTTLGFPILTVNGISVIDSIGSELKEQKEMLSDFNLFINGNNIEYCRQQMFVKSNLELRKNEGDGSYVIPVNQGDTIYVKASSQDETYALLSLTSSFDGNNVILMEGETDRRRFTSEGTTIVSPEDGLVIITDTVYQNPLYHIVSELAINGVTFIRETLTDEINRLKDGLEDTNEDVAKIDVEINSSVNADILPVYVAADKRYRGSEGDVSYVKAVSAGDVVKLIADKYSPSYRNYSLVTAYPSVNDYAAFMTGTDVTSYINEATINVPEDGYIVVTHSTKLAPDNRNPESFKLNDEELIYNGINYQIDTINKDMASIQTGDVSTFSSSHGIFDLESRYWIDNMVLNDKFAVQEKAVVNNFLSKIRSRSNDGVYQIAVISDTHGSGAYSWKSITNTNIDTCFRSVAVFNKIASECDAAIHGGDLSCDYGTSRQRYLQFMQEVLRMFRFDKPFFITKGNHDENNNSYVETDLMNLDWVNNTYYTRDYNVFTSVTEDTWDGSPLYEQKIELISDKEFKNFAQHWLSPNYAVWGDGAYYYYDIEDVKIRFIVANSFPVNDSHVVSEESEYLWFAKKALNFSSVDDRNEWSVIVLRHTQATSITELANCINAFRNGTTWTYNGTTVDFGEMNGGGMSFIAHIHGHEHQWCFSNGAGFLDIGENAAFVDGISLGDASKYRLSVLSIDTTEGKIYEDTIDGHTWCYNYATQKLEIAVGETITMAESGLERPVVSSSSDVSKATCSGRIVTALAEGDVVITVTGNDDTGLEYPITIVRTY